MNKDILFVHENPAYMAVRQVNNFTYTWPATISSPVTTLYKDGADYSSSVLSGSESSSGATQTTRTLTIPSGDEGAKYRLEIKATYSSKTDIKYMDIYISGLE